MDKAQALANLKAAVEAARRADAEAAAAHQLADERLLDLRRVDPDMKLYEIEAETDRYYDRSVISRKTAAALGRSRGLPVAAG